jgi:hypothetical protein
MNAKLCLVHGRDDGLAEYLRGVGGVGIAALEEGNDVFVLHALLGKVGGMKEVAAEFGATIVIHDLLHGGGICGEQQQVGWGGSTRCRAGRDSIKHR